MKNNQVVVYSGKSVYKKGFLNIIKDMFARVINNKELIWQLSLRDFKSRYKQSLLGWLWIFLMPIITMGTFLLLNMSGVIKIGEIPVPYPIFGLLGYSLWQIIANGLPVLTNSIAGPRILVKQINFAKETLVFSSMGQVFIDFFIRVGLVIIVYLFYGMFPPFYILFFPFVIIPLFLLTLGLGFLTSILQVVVSDAKNFINLGLNFFLFLMPIMYTMPDKGILAKINKYNPVYFLIKSARDIFVQGKIDYPVAFIFSSVFSLVVFIIGWFVFYVSEDKLAERI